MCARLLGRACALVVAFCGCGGPGSRSEFPDQAPVNPRVGLAVFPADNPWNLDISQAPVDVRSSQYLASIGLTAGLHPDFGSNPAYGIPYTTVHRNQPPVPVSFDYAGESDPGPYPIPPDAPIEGGAGASGDRHVIVIDLDRHMLFELFAAYPGAAGWQAGSGATWSLDSNALRPAGWTSADAAGLPIFPGLVRAGEVLEQKAIRHALRFTVQRTQRAYVYPARHFASSDTNPDLPPMGMRVRLRASYDISGFPADCRVILQALKTYGMIVADNGSSWFISGASDPRFNDDSLHQLGRVTGADFEVVQTGPLVTQ
jgi:hypothetical protein